MRWITAPGARRTEKEWGPAANRAVITGRHFVTAASASFSAQTTDLRQASAVQLWPPPVTPKAEIV